MIWHVTPINDLKPHIENTTCECQPRTEVMDNGDILVVHSSWDGREAMEEISEILSPNIEGKPKN